LLESVLLVVVVVVEDSPAAGLEAMALVSAGVDAIALVSAGVVVVVVVVSVVVVAEVSAFFWQAPRLQARPAARITAKVVRFIIGKSSKSGASTNTEP
jgi:hypothetical protein